MNKIIIIAAASAVLAALLLRRTKRNKVEYAPVPQPRRNPDRHLTDVFSRAKKHGL